MTATSVPDVLDGLITVWTGVVTGLQVEDGAVYDPQVDFLAVGWDRSDQPAVVGAASSLDIGLHGAYEAYDVSCLLSFWSGKSTLAAVRRAAFAALAQLKDALLANFTLDGVCESAEITDFEYVPDEGESGDQVDVRFTVHVESYPR